MPRMKAGKRAELEAFWRSHLDGWRRSDLNQREYCELHGLPLKRFGNWRAQFKHEDGDLPYKLLYRRGGGLKHMSEHVLDRETGQSQAGYIPSARSVPPGGRRQFSRADKKRIVEEACRPGASVSAVARRHGIGTRLLFHWKQELAPQAAPETTFLPVTVTDAQSHPDEASSSIPESGLSSAPAPVSGPSIVLERPPGIEVELAGGRRVRFDRDVDPVTMHRLITLLEENRS